MAQFVQLQKHQAAFETAGINLVAITYDSPEDQQAFIDKNKITYPFLSDIDAFTVKALDILNPDYAPGDDAYGIPLPGMFVVKPDGTIAGKIFVEGYQTRVNASAVLDYAVSVLEGS